MPPLVHGGQNTIIFFVYSWGTCGYAAYRARRISCHSTGKILSPISTWSAASFQTLKIAYLQGGPGARNKWIGNHPRVGRCRIVTAASGLVPLAETRLFAAQPVPRPKALAANCRSQWHQFGRGCHNTASTHSGRERMNGRSIKISGKSRKAV